MTKLDDIERFEVHFETLEIGQRFVSPRRTVTEADVVNFAGLSGDYNGLPTDALQHAAHADRPEELASLLGGADQDRRHAACRRRGR